ncbi:MAG: hypothetical protein N3G78_10050 [Desulfobacterota bacterium]|nr:hypothetical protein [Thermodesulfobacteriota bacterium]
MNRWRELPKRAFWIFYGAGLGLSLLFGFLLPRLGLLHPHFPFQSFPQFFGLFGLLGCLLLILIAKAMGSLLLKEEDYYEREGRGCR